ncbi:MAG TPA: PDZ domain-containing protein [Phycisphaerae bacterium]|nr:PDZ domain-containing protein [Phycisphaerae bacterium]HNU45871.1 PDZ domain-containing protein [Phycisphaerae bacterium]
MMMLRGRLPGIVCTAVLLSACGTGALHANEQASLALPPEWVGTFHWRSIGPAVMGGRITALAVYEKDPTIWWAATSSGGLVKTTNDGITFEYQFQHENVAAVGDMAVAQSDPNIVWVGTGENNPRNSVTWGDGVYKSTDGGKTWTNMGLKDSFQIGRIAIHPTDPNIVYVGALGRLWGHNPERGLFKTTDGGATWKKVLYIDDRTGVIDVQMHPQDPNTLLVATWERQRDQFDGNDPAKKWGPGSGLYKTTDGGESWSRMTTGLPTCQLGRIGIDYYRKDPNFVYLVLESERIAQEPPDTPFLGIDGEDADVGARLTHVTVDGPAAKAGLQPGDIVLRLAGTTIHSYADLVKQIRKRRAGDTVEIEVSRQRKSVLVQATFTRRPAAGQEDGRERFPFSSGLGGQTENVHEMQGPQGHEYGGVYRSADGGQSWTRVNSVNPRPMYFSQVRVDPSANNFLYVLGIAFHSSTDGGATFVSDEARSAHPDHHALWIDPKDGRHMILGNDGGIYISHDRGAVWDYLNHVAIGQFYHVTVDPRPAYRVYGGLQDNGTWGGPARSRSDAGPVNDDWVLLNWADGFINQVDARDPDQVYFEMQYGGMGVYNFRTGERRGIRPPDDPSHGYRFNWKTPFLLSTHNPGIHYSAANFVFRSVDEGRNLKRISPELTRTREGSITVLAESPLDADLLYAGTDDGFVWATNNGGQHWTRLTDFPSAAPAAAVEKLEEGVSRLARGLPEYMLTALWQCDLNKDGRLQPAELPPPAAALFAQFDHDGSGALDADELQSLAAHLAGAAGALPSPAPGGGGHVPLSQPDARPELPTPDGTAPVPPRTPDTRAPSSPDEWLPPVPLDPALVQASVTPVVTAWSPPPEFTPSAPPSLLETVCTPLVTPRVPPAPPACPSSPQETPEPLIAQAATEPVPAAEPAAPPPESPPPAPTPGAEPRPLAEQLPGPRWVSSMVASRYERDRVYLTLDGHRSDDDLPYVFASEDAGKTWRSLGTHLPPTAGSTRVVREDRFNPDLLYLGTEFGTWVTLDRGLTWTRLNNNLPTVAIHEIAQHPTAGEIVVATHGRSLWVLEVTPLRHMTPGAVGAPAHLYPPHPAIQWCPQLGHGAPAPRRYVAENPPPGVNIYYSIGDQMRQVRLEVFDCAGEELRDLDAPSSPGLHCVNWDLREPPPDGAPPPRRHGRRSPTGGLVPPGTYRVVLTADEFTITRALTVEPDPDFPDCRPWDTGSGLPTREWD